MKKIYLLIFLLITIAAGAQNEIPKLITDRPDQTESSAVVPLLSWQIETGFVLENFENSFLMQQSYAYNTTLLRYGLLKNFELRLGFEYLGEKEENKTMALQPPYLG